LNILILCGISVFLAQLHEQDNTAPIHYFSCNFTPEQLNELRDTFRSEVAGKVVDWRSVILFMQLSQKN
jgi:hypothetical protein